MSSGTDASFFEQLDRCTVNHIAYHNLKDNGFPNYDRDDVGMLFVGFVESDSIFQIGTWIIENCTDQVAFAHVVAQQRDIAVFKNRSDWVLAIVSGLFSVGEPEKLHHLLMSSNGPLSNFPPTSQTLP